MPFTKPTSQRSAKATNGIVIIVRMRKQRCFGLLKHMKAEPGSSSALAPPPPRAALLLHPKLEGFLQAHLAFLLPVPPLDTHFVFPRSLQLIGAAQCELGEPM